MSLFHTVPSTNVELILNLTTPLPRSSTFRLDVCVAAIEDAMEEDAVVVGGNAEETSAEAAAAAVDAFSVASSVISSVTDVLKKVGRGQG